MARQPQELNPSGCTSDGRYVGESKETMRPLAIDRLYRRLISTSTVRQGASSLAQTHDEPGRTANCVRPSDVTRGDVWRVPRQIGISLLRTGRSARPTDCFGRAGLVCECLNSTACPACLSADRPKQCRRTVRDLFSAGQAVAPRQSWGLGVRIIDSLTNREFQKKPKFSCNFRELFA